MEVVACFHTPSHFRLSYRGYRFELCSDEISSIVGKTSFLDNNNYPKMRFKVKLNICDIQNFT